MVCFWWVLVMLCKIKCIHSRPNNKQIKQTNSQTNRQSNLKKMCKNNLYVSFFLLQLLTNLQSCCMFVRVFFTTKSSFSFFFYVFLFLFLMFKNILLNMFFFFFFLNSNCKIHLLNRKKNNNYNTSEISRCCIAL